MKNLNTLQIAKVGIIFVVGMTALGYLGKTIVTIPAGMVGVQEIFGKVSDTPLKPGIHIVNPFGKVVKFPTRLQDAKEQIEATTQEGLRIVIDVSLQYKTNPDKIADIYTEIGTEEEEILISRFRSIVREIIASYPLNSIYSEKRQEIATILRQKLLESIQPLGFEVEEVLLREVILPANVQAAIEAKITAQQQSEQLEFEIAKQRQQAEFDLEIAKTTAEKQKIEAQAKAERQKIAALGEAESQRIIAEGLTPAILQLKTIDATKMLAESQNSKIIILGGGEEVPQIFLPSN